MITFTIIQKLLNHIPKLLILDIDGCLTNGQVNYLGNDQNITFSVYDGEAIIELLKKMEIIVISGRSCTGVIKRCLELGIKEDKIFLKIKDKSTVLLSYLQKHKFNKEEIILLGDQTTDLSLLPFINIFVCPRNTVDFNVLKKADYITFTNGGSSALFELYKLLEYFIQ
jgi:3-deoxy-D-manno-octulosonate 8-phosphate phosphatase (KDO 8-P phosphatase)